MVGLLKYHSKKGTDRGPASQQALDIYNSLAEPGQRKAFLADFESNGGGKSVSALKFAVTFKKRLISENISELSVTDNLLTLCAP